ARSQYPFASSQSARSAPDIAAGGDASDNVDLKASSVMLHLNRGIPAVLIAIGLSAGLTSAEAQSLADAAKKAEQQHNTVNEPSKRYTDADLERPAPCVPVAVSVATPGDPAPPKELTREEIVRALVPTVVTIKTAIGTG